MQGKKLRSSTARYTSSNLIFALALPEEHRRTAPRLGGSWASRTQRGQAPRITTALVLALYARSSERIGLHRSRQLLQACEQRRQNAYGRASWPKKICR